MEKKTELVFILDRSGSMESLAADTVGGFNSTLTAAAEREGQTLVTTVLFNGEVTTLHDRVPLTEVERMTLADFNASGSTALLDAIGNTITHIASIHRYARPEDVPDKTLFFITTDGMENASRAYSATAVRELITSRTKENGWEFHFLAANIDAVKTAGSIGIHHSFARQVDASKHGVRASYAYMAEKIKEEKQ